ncbi:MAG: type II toxin-antitoxin system Phd/YefM family antitoxin [Desulfatiglandaceae bacterium]|jgi:prevent-host-death family protein
MEKGIWQLQEAKNKFSNLVEKAQKNGPQIVTKRGRKTVVVLSFREYERITKPKLDLVTFLRKSSLAEVELEISRDKNLPRGIEI